MSRMDDWNYHRDPRTWDLGPEPFKVLQAGPNTSRVRLHDALLEDLMEDGTLPEDHDGEMDVRSKFEVCGQCEGSGTMVDPRIDAGGIPMETFHEDPDFAEDYFGGRYDVRCSRCKGKRVEPVMVFPEAIQKAVEDWWNDAWEHAAESAAERAMGA